ncbi:MAG: DNA-protecting protein DprA [Muribaculaceae bacterium]|nr:DNA-protecting protein DprA [Muribaculaceae bacterium]
MSEQPFGVKANPTRLVARNRLQAAMSKAVILAQCPEKSGSLHTMRFARKYGKEALAVKFPVMTLAIPGLLI